MYIKEFDPVGTANINEKVQVVSFADEQTPLTSFSVGGKWWN